MSKTAVVYWSGTGNTQAMAEAVAAAAQADIFTAAEFSADLMANYDAVAFGCPSMGAEQLEESEFEPMFASVKPALGGKKIALFGSYGWGDGEWMRTWEEDCLTAGAQLVSDSVICQESPDSDALAECESLGAALKNS
ncbi:MAG: flavodoxin [Clostridia bacterium]|nr:flavodoxin [Clostridia bacterium]MBQ8508014.1 flavodoxin [Clostridia bacterium]